MSCIKENNLIVSDDEELPNLVDRIQSYKRSPIVLPCKEVLDSGSDDETEFLNLIEKVSKTPQIPNKNRSSNKENVPEILKSSCTTFKTPQSQVKSQNTAFSAVASDSEDEEEFLKFSERIRNTPYSQNRNSAGRYLQSLVPDVPKKKKLFSGFGVTEKKSESHGQIEKTSLAHINSSKNGTSNKDKAFEFLKPLDICHSTPQLQVKSRSTLEFAILSDSEDEEGEFLKFSGPMKRTPLTQFKKPDTSILGSLGTDFSEKKKLFSVPILGERKESSFHGPIKRTPLTQFNNRQNAWSGASPAVYLSSESDDESEFFKFSERIRNTPQSQNVMQHSHVVSSDSEDDAFVNLSKNFRQLNTPRSRSQNPVDENSPLSDFPERKNLFPTPSTRERNNSKEEPVPDSLKVTHATNVKEYEMLFPSKSETPESFLRNREKYAHQLFDFFNRKIFDSQLPLDLALVWDGALLRTAGIHAPSIENEEHKSIIKLSPGLLTSFDRLQDTLLHEMCHAAVWIISKARHVQHGPLWQIWASRCTWILPFITCPERCHNYGGNFRVWYYCPKCNIKIGRCKQSRKYANGKCKTCKIPFLMTFNDFQITGTN